MCVFVLALLSWLCWRENARQITAFWLLAITFAVHTGGLLSRMWLQGRPPVTNLYSSAIFIGWAACALCIILESIYRDGIGSLTAATMGFITLIIAHHLSFEGDTMEMLRAVLDTNHQLATTRRGGHARLRLHFSRGLPRDYLCHTRCVHPIARQGHRRSLLNNMVYGIICFATLFSFVGTVLGGIWADQSWGRFWDSIPRKTGR